MKTWITSDIHLSHKNILKYCPERREWAPLPPDGTMEYNAVMDQMNETIIQNWNSLVGTEDLVYILGDVAMGQIINAPPLIRRLNGTKIIIKGNHDKTLVKLPEFSDLFKESYDYKELWYKYGDTKHLLVLSHYPMQSWNGMGAGTIHFHGHLHGSESGLTGRIKDVGLDTNNLFPYLLDSVVKEMLQISCTRHHHEG